MSHLNTLLSTISIQFLKPFGQRGLSSCTHRTKSGHLKNNSRPWQRAVIVLLIVFLIANPIFAAPGMPVILATMANELKQEFRFQWFAQGLGAIGTGLSWAQFGNPGQQRGRDGRGAPRPPRPTPAQAEKREDRERRVSQVKIFPGDVTLTTGQQAIFSAVAYDKDGEPISGVNVRWEGFDEEKKQAVSVSTRAAFASGTPGKYTITADIAGRKAHVNVTVTGLPRAANVRGEPQPRVSSHDKPKPRVERTSLLAPMREGASHVARQRHSMRGKADSRVPSLRASATALRSSAALFFTGEDEFGWNSGNYTTADDPGAERGSMPGHAVDGGAGSGNFQFTAPLLAMNGRGLDLNLEFNYNSRLWHKSGNDMYFDVDRDWLPGWTLGFGKIVMAGTSYMMIDGDGTRHSYDGIRYTFPNSQCCSSLQSYEAYTTDGSFIDYYVEGYLPEHDNSNGKNISRAWAKLPNGTSIEYGAQANYAIYPTQIIDANGNFISITYRNNEGPQIATITDTLGRQLIFHYDGSGLLTAVTAPPFNGGSGQKRVLVRLQYGTRNLQAAGPNYGFTNNLIPRVRNSGTINVVRAIYYPATNTGYWFGELDTFYSRYGMLRKVSERRGMTCSVGGQDCASTNNDTLIQQASIGAGLMSREAIYSNPDAPGYSDHFWQINDTPTYKRMTEDWAGRDTPAAPVTKYEIVTNGWTRTTKITRPGGVQPDGVRVEQDTNNDPNSIYYGLITEDRTYPDATSQTPLRKSRVGWQRLYVDPDDSSTWNTYYSPRPTFTEVTDERGQTTLTTYSYSDPSNPLNGDFYNQVVDKIEYGYGGIVQLHRTYTEYENDQSYRGQWINRGQLWGDFGLVSQWSGPHIFNLVEATTVYAAADNTRVARTEYQYDQHSLAPLQDLDGTPKNAPQHIYAATQRGNPTSIKRFADAQTLDGNTAVSETRHYDICGNVVKATTACCEQTTFKYSSNTEFAWPEVTIQGAATDTTKQNTTEAVYDLYTGLLKQSTDANGLVSYMGYQALTLRPEWEFTPTSSYTWHEYDDANLGVYDYAYEAGQGGTSFAWSSEKYLDGHGRVTTEYGYGKDYASDVVWTTYDNLGRRWQQSRPYREGSSSPHYTYEYDALDRTKKVTAPDGSVVERFYNEASYPSAATQNAPGQTVRARDAWGRERWARFDEQNRLVEVVEPKPDGDGTVANNGLRTNYTYDTLGNLILTEQGDQTRRFKYDALNRLTHQKLAERDATLNNQGSFVATWDQSQKKVTATNGAQWSDVFAYDNRSNLIWRVDARGVKTNFNYNSDPLNRMQSVTYDTSGVPAALTNTWPIAPAKNVTYGYEMQIGRDLSRVRQVNVDAGFGNEQLNYDAAGRLNWRRQTFTWREGAPLDFEYTWDSLDRLQMLKYPAQHGAGGAQKIVEQTFDLASRVDGLKYDGTNYASNFTYNAASQTTSLNIGSQLTETYTFDPKTGLLFDQQVKQGQTKLLDLAYNYTLGHDPANNYPKTGQLTGVSDKKSPVRSRAFIYDNLGRMQEVWGGADPYFNPTWWAYYAYDRYGNRFWVGKDGSAKDSVPLDAIPNINAHEHESIFYDASQQYKTLTNRNMSEGYEYDPAGNQMRGQSGGVAWQQYRYDAAGRLVEVWNGGGTALLESHGYGASNARLMTVQGGTTTYYGWDGGQIVAEYAAAGSNSLAWQKSYVYLGGRLLATQQVGLPAQDTTQFHHPDRLGTRLVTNGADGAIVSEQVGQPYGTMLANGVLHGEGSYQDPNANRANQSQKRFTSYDRSQTTGLDYAVNRFYNSAQGRFTQVDPIGMEAASLEDPQTLNLYSYCGNDPINHIDPDGLFWGKLFGAFKRVLRVIGIAAAVAVVLALSWNIGTILGVAVWKVAVGAGAAIAASYGADKLAGVLGGVAAFGGVSFRTPSTFPRGTGVGAVSYFIEQQRRGNRPKAPAIVPIIFVGAIETINIVDKAPDEAPDKAPSTFWDCFNKYKFTSGVGTLFGPTAESIAEVTSVTSYISFAGDMVATARKALGKPLGGPQKYASGINWVFRRLSRGSVRGTLTTIGGRVLTPAFAVTAVFTGTYDLGIAAQCASGILK